MSHRGYIDWIAQRVTAVLIAAYTLFLVCFVLVHQPLDFGDWYGLFATTVMKIASSLVLLSILWHAWIGLWTVSTDYIKCGCLRLFFQVAVIVLLLAYVFWGLDIVWSVTTAGSTLYE